MDVNNILYMEPPRQLRKERQFRGNVFHNFNDNELRQRYRFGRRSLDFLIDLLKDDLERGTAKKSALTVEQQLTIGMRFYASGSFLQVIGDTLGYDKSTVSRCISNVTDAILARKGEFIKWPVNTQRVKMGFYKMAHFPNVIGCIYCTHIRIQAPHEDEPAFVNRKSFHSINTQAVCDHEGKFTQITANWPGSVHDSHIFRTSTICDHLETNHRGLIDGVILGDSGYACRPFLLTPYNNPQHPYQELFNRSHCSTRSIIERTFGIWKRRFHVLHSEIRMKPQKVCRIIGACAVLHNIAIMLNEPLDENNEDNVQTQVPIPNYNGQQDGKTVREHIAREFFRH